MQLVPATAWAQQRHSVAGSSPALKAKATLLLPRSGATLTVPGRHLAESSPSPGKALSCPNSPADRSRDTLEHVRPSTSEPPSPSKDFYLQRARECTSVRPSTSDVKRKSRGASPQLDTKQNVNVDNSSLPDLLGLWKERRYSSEALSQDERQCIEGILFKSMPADRVKIVDIRRLPPSELLNKFCQEEQESLDRQQNQHRKHKEFMLLHGTRWEYAPLIEENGLDPNCGHLSTGTWLGGLAEKAHSYAIKGPGPAQDDGTRLFALFAVACVPNTHDGDDERSFGVWRIQSGKRMCPAYAIVYSAPMNIKGKQPPEPRMNKLTMARLRSASPCDLDNHARSPVFRQRSWDVFDTSHTGPALKVQCASPKNTELQSPQARPRSADPSTYVCTSPSLKAWTSPRPKACTSPSLKVHQESPVSPKLTPRNSDGQFPHASPPASKGRKSTVKDKRPSTGGATCEKAEESDRQSLTVWEVLVDGKWIPFCPGSKFKDHPGAEQHICKGQFWYVLKFDADGLSGSQKNTSTGKVRPLRRVQSSDEQSIASESDKPQQVSFDAQPCIPGANVTSCKASPDAHQNPVPTEALNCKKAPAETDGAPRIVLQPPGNVRTTFSLSHVAAWYPNLLAPRGLPLNL